MSKTPHGTIAEIMHARAAEGARHFPHPAAPKAAQPSHLSAIPPKEQPIPQNQPITQVDESLFKTAVQNCADCSLCQDRARVVVSDVFFPRKVMIISDFPEKSDELSSRDSLIFTPQNSPHNVLQRLINYLNISENVHRSFAIKCVAARGIPNETSAICAKHLLKEIALVDPNVIVCSGLRSARSALQANPWNLAEAPELGEIGPIVIEGRLRRVLLIPSARELEANEKWRGPVGGFLKQALSQV